MIFLDNFMKRIYSFINGVEALHIVGTYERGEEEWLRRLRGSRRLLAEKVELEEALDEKRREVKALQKAMADMQSALAMERKRSQRAAMQKDRMHVSNAQGTEIAREFNSE